MTRNTVTWIAVLVSCLLPSGCANRSPKIPTAEEVRSEAQRIAKKEGKQVLLLFSDPNSDLPDNNWSERFDRYHADPEVRRVIDKYFVLARIDVQETPGGRHMYEEFGGSGTIPAFSILDAHGMLLADSGRGEENFGFPVKPEEIERYFEALKTACPQMTDLEVKLLRGKLGQSRSMEESPERTATPEPSAGAPVCQMSLRRGRRSA